MPKLLTQLKIDGIHFVDKGASGDDEDRPKVAIWKRRHNPQEVPVPKPAKKTISLESIIKALKDAKTAGKAADVKVHKAAVDVAQSYVTIAKMGELPEGAQAQLEEIKGKLDESQWALIEMMLAGGMPATPAPEPPAPEPTPKADDDPEPAPAPAPAEEEKMGDHMAKLAKSNPELHAILKAQQVEIEKANDRVEKAEKRADKAEEQLKKAQDATEKEIEKRRDAEFMTLAKSMPHVPGKTEELAKTLKQLEDALDPEAYQKQVEAYRAIDKAMRENLPTRGIGRGGYDVEGSAAAEIKKMADDLRKEDPTLTQAKALVKVRKENPKLRKREREESREG